MKRKSIAAKIFGCILAAILLTATLLFTACGDDGIIYTIPPAELPTAEQFALKQYDYENLSDVQTTVRADMRNVLERNLPRPDMTDRVLGDDFSIIYDSATKTITTDFEALQPTAGTEATATIHFNRYPTPSSACNGANAFSNGSMNGSEVAGSNADFYKYMLMAQGHHLAAEAQQRSLNGTLTQEWLKKHPAADAQYGRVLGENNAVKKEIILDPIYRSFHTTGLYLPAGEAVTVEVSGLKPGERISAILGVQDSLAWVGGANNDAFLALTGNTNVNLIKADTSDAYFKRADVLVANGQMSGNVTHQGQWARQNARLPWLRGEFFFNENKTYTIGNAFGGAIEIGMNNCYSRVKVTITGAVETPHYVLGQTTPEYFDQYLRDAPGVIAVLDTENGQLIGPTGEMGTHSYMRQVKTDEIDKLAMLWHSFLSVNESFTGGSYNRFNKIMFDWHVPAGAAVALGNYSFAHPTGWFDGAMNYRRLLSHGHWGPLHEIGHNHSSAYGTVWGFGGGQEGEVRNNALTVLAYILLCDVGTTMRNTTSGLPEHGGYADPYRVLSEAMLNRGRFADFANCGYFQALGMYANIMHSFGAEKYFELLYTYKADPSFCSNKRADFAYRCARVYHMNFLKYFNEFYGAGIKEDMYTEEQWNEMQALPKYEPVSCFYAGGIDGVKTAGDYLVTFGNDITFELQEKTICSLDTADRKGFEILRVNQPTHGKITEQGDGKWAYSFDKEYTGIFDEFSFDVKLSDGIVHTLTITLRISYNGGRVTAYNNVTGNNLDEIIQYVADKEPDFVAGSTNGKVNYQTTTGTKDVRISEFYWQAPKSGEISLSMKCDDWARVYFGEDFDTLEQKFERTHNINSFQDYNAKTTVEEGKFYAVKIFNVNTGGVGGASFGVKYADGDYAEVSASDVYHPLYPLGQPAPTYIYEPKFLVSKKDNIKLAMTGTDKSEWTVVKAPTNLIGGRTFTEQQIDPDTGEPGGTITVDRWTYLIDGLANTNIHTTYGGGVPKITPSSPHEFIIDTAKVQSFNFFSITTRNNVNSYITDFELQISDSADGEWTTVVTGDRNNYSGTTITMKFHEVSGRYWRLLVKGTTGGNFSVLAELDTGIQATTQQVVPPTSNKFFATEGWVNSRTLPDEANGYLISTRENEKLVIKFEGEAIAVYGATGVGYGTADVYIDGKKEGSFDLNSTTEDSRKLIFNKEELENKEHTVEIITTSAGKVALSVFGIPYSANLINAPDIYKEGALTVALVVFILLFVALAAFIVVLVFVPKLRSMIFGSRAIKKLDERGQRSKKEKADKAEAKTVKTTPEKATEKTNTTESVSKPETKPVQKTATQAKTETKPAAKPTVTNTTRVAPKPAASKSETKPAAKPTVTNTTRVAPKPAASKADKKPAAKPTAKSVGDKKTPKGKK